MDLGIATGGQIMKKISIIISCLTLFVILLMLAGCGGENIHGTIKFYDEPTVEFAEPVGMSTTNLSDKQVEEIKKIISNVDGWTDDYDVDRVEFYFDGEIEFSDSDTVYYFSYERNVIYYDHCFGHITEEEMEYIKKIK